MRTFATFLATCALVACAQRPATAPAWPAATVAARAEARPLVKPAACDRGFFGHTLPHETTTATGAVEWFDSNGAGVAAGDLDDDGLLDLVFANLAGPPTIFWNRGGLNFEKALTSELTELRQPAIVDVDGDGRLDIVFTQRLGPPVMLRNLGARNFQRENLLGVNEPAYTIGWADFDGDGDLDLAAASYNAELAKAMPNDFLFNKRGGVWVYDNLGNFKFSGKRLTSDSHALALLAADLNEDGRTDLWIGNDFDLQEGLWLNQPAGWLAATQPWRTTHSTMSLSRGDIDNDGSLEVFASDMRPNSVDTQTWVQWLPTMQSFDRKLPVGDPQSNENMLYVRMPDGSWLNNGLAMGIDAAGWAWSAQFGDLDRDGFQDLYIVNGMMDQQLFKHLQANTLVEKNWAFRNIGGTRFVPAHDLGLGSELNGRGMLMADLDNDGDLDIAINNLLGPASVFENRICDGQALEVQLRQPGANWAAIGAQVRVETSSGTYTRDVHVGSGHISSDAARVHVGMPAAALVRSISVRWPDGTVSSLLQNTVNQLLTITR